MNSGNKIIDRTTSIKTLLDVNEDGVITALVKLNRNFSKLKNPVLRRLLAKRVSIEDACKIAKCNLPDFFHTMESIGFSCRNEDLPARLQEDKPVLEGMTEVELDVRPVLAENKDPLKLILKTVQQLKKNECLKLINSFEPTPLITLLRNKGYKSVSRQIAADLVITWFYISPDEERPEAKTTRAGYSFDDMMIRFQEKLRVIDVTQLGMPLPMQTILKEIQDLLPGEALFVHHKKVPVYLLPHLQDQGFEYLIWEEGPAKVSLLIFRL